MSISANALRTQKRISYFNDDFLSFHKPAIDDAEIRAVVETLRSGWLTTGQKVKRFEEEFASYVGAKHAVAVNSGTAALHLRWAMLWPGIVQPI